MRADGTEIDQRWFFLLIPKCYAHVQYLLKLFQGLKYDVC